MNTSDLLLLFSVLIAVIQTAMSIECFVCNSGENPECGDEDFGKTKDFLEQCRVEDTVCMKQQTQTYHRVEGKQEKATLLTTRFCGSDNDAGCTEKVGAQSRTTQCACNGNQCNAGTKHAASFGGVVVVSLFLAWLWQ